MAQLTAIINKVIGSASGSRRVGIGNPGSVILVDATLNDSVQFEAELTSHPVERGLGTIGFLAEYGGNGNVGVPSADFAVELVIGNPAPVRQVEILAPEIIRCATLPFVAVERQ